MKHCLCVLLSGLLPVYSMGQITVLSGTTLQIAGGTAVTLSSPLQVAAGSTLSNDGMLYLSGNVTDNGTITGTGTLAFTGTSLQQLSGTSTLPLPVLQLNNAAGLDLQLPVTITGQLQLTAGQLTAGAANPLHFAPSATSPVETPANRIVGTAVMDARPVGTGALGRFLDLALSAGADIGQVTITRTTGPSAVVTAGTNASIGANWIVSTSVTPAAADRTTTFYWLSSNDNGKNMAAMDLYAAPPPYTHNTRLNAASQDVSAGNPRAFAQPGITNFSQRFTLSDQATPLPLRLLDFTASRKATAVVLAWHTAGEEDLARIVPERSTDGLQFAALLQTLPAGGPENSYQYKDSTAGQLRAPRIYYRLHLILRSGAESYSAVRAVELDDPAAAVIAPYPNPFTGIITVTTPFGSAGAARITDLHGRLVYRQALDVNGRTDMDLRQLLPGSYALEVCLGAACRRFLITRLP